MTEQAAEQTAEQPVEQQSAAKGFKPIESQEELNGLLSERLKRQAAQYGGSPAEVKAALEKLAQLEDAQKSEAEKAAEARTAAEKRAADLEAALRHKTVESALITAAAGKLADPKDAVLYLGDKLELDAEGNADPAAVAQLVDGLLSEREYLGAKTTDGRPAVPRPNTAQGTSGTPATADPAQQFGAILNARMQGA